MNVLSLSFFDRKKSGEILSRVTNDLDKISETLQISLLKFIIAGKFMLDGTMSIGVVQTFFQYINQSAEPLTQASFMINNFQASLASAERTFEILDQEREVRDTAHPLLLDRAKGDITFENVSFGYEPGELLMKNIYFKAKAGQKIAIVGSTGAGKATRSLTVRAQSLGRLEADFDHRPHVPLESVYPNPRRGNVQCGHTHGKGDQQGNESVDNRKSRQVTWTAFLHLLWQQPRRQYRNKGHSHKL